MTCSRLAVVVFFAACHAPFARHVEPAKDPPSSGVKPRHYNRAFSYLKGAEIQFETPEQGMELHRALIDMSTLSPADLCARRYADYDLTAGQWTLAELLRHYVVPQPLQTIADEPAFCREAAAPEARSAARDLARSLNGSPPGAGGQGGDGVGAAAAF